MAKNDVPKSVRCSFCGKSQESVKKIVAGPGDYICDECVDLCTSIIAAEVYEDEEVGYTLNDLDKIPSPKEIKKIFEQGELSEKVVVSKMEIPTPHGAIPGKTQLSPTNYYNLDAIISVGYRVNSIQATKFRIWATNVLKEYMIKGFTMDDERLKQGKTAFGRR